MPSLQCFVWCIASTDQIPNRRLQYDSEQEIRRCEPMTVKHPLERSLGASKTQR